MIFQYGKNINYSAASEIKLDDVLWLDIVLPTAEEEKQLENLLGIDIPTMQEMAEIELSNRLYEENGAVYLTSVLLVGADTANPQTEAVTFIITPKLLITLRYSDIGAFKQYISRLDKNKPQDKMQLFLGLSESVINRLADILEKIGVNIDSVSKKIFREKLLKNLHDQALKEVGISGDLISKARESLITNNRILVFLEGYAQQNYLPNIKIMLQDVNALSVHADFLSNKAMFLLDATLGMINFEQNKIIKIFTLVALVFLPPTLIAGIYGMNFKYMPELEFASGYPMALIIMLFSAVLPYWYFKRKGWL